MATDKAERLVKTCSGACGSGEVLLTQLSYASANLPANGLIPPDWRRGKLVQARAIQPSFTLTSWVTSGTTTITEDLEYKGTGGRVSARTTTLSIAGSTTGNLTNHTFTQTFAWNELGRPAALGYGSCGTTTPCNMIGNRGVYPTYTAGWLTGVGPYYAQSISYHWNGLPNTVIHTKRLLEPGLGVYEITGLSASKMARPSSMGSIYVTTTSGAYANWTTGTYAYDGAGNVIQTKRMSSNREYYRYDGLSRLVSATRVVAGAETTQAFAYDDYGNLTTLAGVALGTDAATNRLTGATYDEAGRTTGWSNYTYTWDAQGQLIGESGNSLGRIFAYTADGERLLQRDGSTYTLSLRDLDGQVIRELTLAAATTGARWTWKRDNVYRGGLLLASVAPGEGIRHYHLDHLGTPRQVTNRTGQQVVRHDTWPYGREAALSGNQTPDRMRFTGHERDLNLLNRETDDLDYMHARYYNPTNLGRFLSVDEGDAEPIRPGSWNRYTYVLSSPQRLVDPDGEAAEAAPALAALPALGPAGLAIGAVGAAVALDQQLPPELRSSTYIQAAAQMSWALSRAFWSTMFARKVTESAGGEEHTKGERQSTKPKHEAGQARKKKDRGGEKGDGKRRPPRRRPKGHVGPWPPTSNSLLLFAYTGQEVQGDTGSWPDCAECNTDALLAPDSLGRIYWQYDIWSGHD